MAGMFVSFNAGEQALTAATARTVLQLIAPTNQRGRVKQVSATFDGVSTTAEPVVVRLLRQTNAIGGSPTTVTGVLTNAGSETVQFTGASSAGGTEPTGGNVLFRWECHPQGGLIVPFSLDFPVEIPGGTRLGMECTAPAGVNVIPVIVIEE